MIKENVKYFDAVVGGVEKCGTTSLIRYLKQHPDIYVPWNKEKDRDPRWWGDWTGDIDHNIPNKMMIFRNEFLIRRKDDLEKVRDLNPDIKIIVSFRDPVKRAYSHYWHHVTKDGLKESFEESIEPDSEFYDNHLKLGEYKRLVQNLENFPDENKYFIIAEELWDDLDNGLSNLFSFLEVEEDFRAKKKVRTNPSGAPRYEFLNNLATGNRKIPFISENYPKLMKFIGRGIRIFNLKEKPPMDEKTKKKLAEYYRERNEGLSEMIGKDLSEWWEWWE